MFTSSVGGSLDMESTILASSVSMVYVAAVCIMALVGGLANKQTKVHMQLLTQIEFSLGVLSQKLLQHAHKEDSVLINDLQRQSRTSKELLAITRKKIKFEDLLHPITALFVRADVVLVRLMFAGIASYISVLAGVVIQRQLTITVESI